MEIQVEDMHACSPSQVTDHELVQLTRSQELGKTQISQTWRTNEIHVRCGGIVTYPRYSRPEHVSTQHYKSNATRAYRSQLLDLWSLREGGDKRLGDTTQPEACMNESSIRDNRRITNIHEPPARTMSPVFTSLTASSTLSHTFLFFGTASLAAAMNVRTCRGAPTREHRTRRTTRDRNMLQR
jgi:hypothetical protein